MTGLSGRARRSTGGFRLAGGGSLSLSAQLDTSASALASRSSLVRNVAGRIVDLLSVCDNARAINLLGDLAQLVGPPLQRLGLGLYLRGLGLPCGPLVALA